MSGQLGPETLLTVEFAIKYLVNEGTFAAME